MRNLAHIRFGRMERRYDELRGKHMAEALESMTGSKLPDVGATRWFAGLTN